MAGVPVFGALIGRLSRDAGCRSWAAYISSLGVQKSFQRFCSPAAILGLHGNVGHACFPIASLSRSRLKRAINSGAC